jgi:hypothetical protein
VGARGMGTTVHLDVERAALARCCVQRRPDARMSSRCHVEHSKLEKNCKTSAKQSKFSSSPTQKRFDSL